MIGSRLIPVPAIILAFKARGSGHGATAKTTAASLGEDARALAELQEDLERWLEDYNGKRSHQGRWCFGKTPKQTFLDALPIAKEKLSQQAA